MLNPDRVLAELAELRALTEDGAGAQRVAWSDLWLAARRWYQTKLAALPVEVHTDAAANLWATLPGRDTGRTLVIGSHFDSVPNGGWLDGSLGMLAGLEVLRRLAAAGTPPVTVRLVDFADEEGARFGHSVLGSSAATGAFDPAANEGRTDKEGVSLRAALARVGVEMSDMPQAAAELANAAAYLELHIEQGPVLEGAGLPLGAVTGTRGIRRHALQFSGVTAHAGSTPMEVRRDTLLAAARLALAVRSSAVARGGVGTVGSVQTYPGIPTAIAGTTRLTIDQRHLDLAALDAMLADVRSACAQIAAEEGVQVTWEPLYSIDPVHFHPALVDFAAEAIAATGAEPRRLPSGALHDASAVAKRGIPTVMLFVQSLKGLSHTNEEDTLPEHLLLAVRALDGLVTRTMAWVSG